MHRLMLRFLISIALLLPLHAETPIATLFAPQTSLAYRLSPAPKGWLSTPLKNGTLLTGPDQASEANIQLFPASGQHFDLSSASYLRLELKNCGQSLLWIEGRLDNQGAQDWSNSTGTQAFLLPGETGTLGFAYPRASELDDSPAIFRGMAGKLNGWRSHWKAFDPAKVLQLRLRIHSAQPGPKLEVGTLSTAWPYGSVANTTLQELPFLDPFGQLRQLDWPGKLMSTKELRARASAEDKALKASSRAPSFNKFGGWNDGPQLEATGHFRLTKHEGKWWFVDPEGRLFWSHGVCSVGFNSSTPLQDRTELFAWIPEESDPLFPSTISHQKGIDRINYFGANLHRKFGLEWQSPARDLVHRRFASWGLNTLGAWSEEALQTDQRTPYTPIFHLGYPQLWDHKIPQPYGGELAANTRKALQNFVAKHGQDPWIVGVFIDNEIHWPGDLAAKVLEKPTTHPAKAAAVEILMQRHKTIEALNKKWSTQFASWTALATSTDLPWSEARRADFDAIQFAYAKEYFSVCEAAVREVLPHKLYLGSRIHSCPDFVSRAAAKHVDAISVNHYWNTAGLGRAPSDVDVPVIITEFHFGALDRGVPGASLGAVHDQLTRARAYQNYVASALTHPRIIGTHWFAWSDQSSAGRPGENYQIGLVDITDTPYPEFTGAVSSIGQNLYQIRSSNTGSHLPALQALFQANQRK